jgi:O-antigen/teichoic acid export membrane protein
MITVNSIFKKGIIALVLRFAGALLNFLLSIYIARYLAKEDYGDYQFLMTLITGGSLFARVGMDTYLMSKLPGEKVKRKQLYALQNAIILVFICSIILALLTFIVYLAYLFVYGKPILLQMILLICISLLPYSNFMLISSIEKAKEHINKSLFISNIFPPLLMYLVMEMTKNNYDKLGNTISSYLLSSVLVFLISMLILIRGENKLKLLANINFYHVWLYFNRGRKYILHSLMAYLLLWVDLIIIGIFLGGEYTADYSVASRVTLIILLAMSVYDGMVSPIIIKSYKLNSSNEFIKKIAQIFSITVTFITFFVVVMIVFAEYIIPLYGDNYKGSIIIARILIAAYAVKGLASLPGYVLIAMNKVANINKILMVSLLINIIMSYYLMQYYSTSGVAIGTLISSSVVVIASYYVMIRNFKVMKIAG